MVAEDTGSDGGPGQLAVLKAIVGLEDHGIALMPDTFGGVWLEEKGRSVHIGFTKEPERNMQRLLANWPADKLLVIADNLVAELVPESRLATKSRAAELVELRESIASGERLDTPFGNDHSWSVSGASIFHDVRIEVAKAPDGLEEWVEERFGPVTVATGSLSPAACDSRLDCRYSMRGGVYTGGAHNSCTTAFVVRQADGSRGVLSAGHCNNSDMSPYECGTNSVGDIQSHPGTSNANRYGNVVRDRCAGRVDAEVHSVDSSGTPWASKPWVYESNANKNVPITMTVLWDVLADGAWICKHGAVTGRQCGAILSTHHEGPSFADGAPGSNWIQAQPCVRAGDSGSAVTMNDGHAALGVVSATWNNQPNEKGDTDCDEWQDGGSNPDWMLFGSIEYIQNQLDVVVVTTP